MVPRKSSNKTGVSPEAERMEGRGGAKGNPPKHRMPQTQGWLPGMKPMLERIRQVAAERPRERFTALLHHVYDVERLKRAYGNLNKHASAGIDGVTWEQYGQRLEENLQDLSARIRRGGYRPQAVRRSYIPKADGRQRPLGITTLEDKVVQQATSEVLQAIYEADFLGFSYGFRPKRHQHMALTAVFRAVMTKKVNWVLDADIRGFFDAIDHDWLIKFLEHRIADQRVIRLIRKWLKAGVLEDESWRPSEEGTPQGGCISPLLANIYLHYALDLWVRQWRDKKANGDVVIVRFADDFIVGFQYQQEAEKFLRELRERFRRFGLELQDKKTRLIEFGRFAASNRKRRGKPKPETFDFLGFTHICATSRKGKFFVLRQTRRTRMREKLQEIRQQLRYRLHDPVARTGPWLRSVMLGHLRYYGVSCNGPALNAFKRAVRFLWHHSLGRRSHKAKRDWARHERHLRRWLPPVRIYHSFPKLYPTSIPKAGAG